MAESNAERGFIVNTTPTTGDVERSSSKKEAQQQVLCVYGEVVECIAYVWLWCFCVYV